MDVGVSWIHRQEHTRSVKSWRDPPEQDEPRGGGRSHREGDSRDSDHYDRGDYRLNPMWTSSVWTLMLNSLLQVCSVMMTASSSLSSHQQTKDGFIVINVSLPSVSVSSLRADRRLCLSMSVRRGDRPRRPAKQPAGV